MKIITIVGARPQFIKAASVSRAIIEHNLSNDKTIKEIIVHTGQHYDLNMSDIFFDEMDIPRPDYNLEINGLNHGAMTGRMLEEIEKILLEDKPDAVMVYGDTNSTLAGSLAAAKLHIPVAHVEAGLRSFNMKMPEEINRTLTDRVSTWLFCPTETAVRNLHNEGYAEKARSIITVDSSSFTRNRALIANVGDVMFDAALFYKSKMRKPAFEIPGGYILATIHRAENTDNEENIRRIIEIFNALSADRNIIIPIHPRTKGIIARYGLKFNDRVMVIDPVGYLEMVYLISNSSIVMTDSGGLQKEAFFFGKPCITLRPETEWVELVENKVNILTDLSGYKINAALDYFNNNNTDFNLNLYGEGNASNLIISELLTC